ncbi:hypothetical protein FXO37_29972 [Capsicum annuum]|nr:hypothetical protein FXO37_29972 [Capsicum annuum]
MKLLRKRLVECGWKDEMKSLIGPTTDVHRISSFVLVISAICSTVKSSGSNTSCTSAHSQLQAHHLSLSHAHALGNFGSSPSMCGSGYAKQLPQKAPMHAPAFTTTNTISLMRTMELSVAARKKKQTLPVKHLHEKVAAMLPESTLYTQLLQFESRL